MRVPARLTLFLLSCAVAGCGSDTPTICCTDGSPALRVVNAFTTPVSVLIDGKVALASLAAGAIDTTAPTSGAPTLELRAVGGGAAATFSLTITNGALSTVAAVRSSNGA